ncbi:hypothetical protein DYD21_10855 [Rhodohalobacter sp. SW132]|uniref:tetratricopeptide repeat protein n=1 Tax=Rhodohalobacter sp. SW132 TaxID=2293433 RepID=UPI000E244A03|nr:tetratricopeptide repeat protein [Rhodohalobacter sp. SW132]REL33274.1 hypothetical protein DYD21_10855 [Rhodohalobacter sp. SW132]
MKSLKFILFPFLLAGFIWACEATDPLVSEMETNSLLGNYDAVLETANQALEQDSSNSLAYFYRGLAYGSQAYDIELPWERTERYADSRQAFVSAKEWMERAESRPSEYEEIDEIITGFWAEEHNEAVGYLTDDSLRATVDDPERYAIGHLNNAITIQPDSSLSYIVLASTQFNQGDVPASIETYEMAMQRMETPEVEDYEFLISLYIDQGRFDDAEALTQEAVENHPDNTQFIQFLADIYIQQGNMDEAISIIEELIADEPDNPQYYRVLGTQIYQNVTSINDRISQKYDEVFQKEREARQLSGEEGERAMNEVEQLREEIAELEAESQELTDIAIENMEEVVRLNPDDDDGYNILGIIYQNQAALYFDQRNSIVDDQQRVQELDELARESLEQARHNYERAAEIDPNVAEYWESLLQVYTNLGMEEEAREAMERADM